MRAQPDINQVRRLRVTNLDGVVLDRAYVYLRPQAWAKLIRLAESQGQSVSEYLGSIVEAK